MSDGDAPARLTVVVVTHQSANHVSSCLASLTDAAAGLAFDLIVLDNASTDGTPDLVQNRFPQARLLRAPVNRGFGAGVNQAVSLAKTEVLLLLNPDAAMGSTSLRTLFEELARRPGAAGVGPLLVYPDGSRQISARPRLTPATVLFEALLLDRLFPSSPWIETRAIGPDPLEVECLSGACLLLRTRAFASLGGLDERFFMYGEDVDLCLRARRAGYSLWLVPEARVEHIEGGSSRQNPVRFLANLHRAKVQLVQKHHPRSLGGLLPGLLRANLRFRAALHLILGGLLPGSKFLQAGRDELAAACLLDDLSAHPPAPVAVAHPARPTPPQDTSPRGAGPAVPSDAVQATPAIGWLHPAQQRSSVVRLLAWGRRSLRHSAIQVKGMGRRLRTRREKSRMPWHARQLSEAYERIVEAHGFLVDFDLTEGPVDLWELDRRIESAILASYAPDRPPNPRVAGRRPGIALLFTELYPTGGHTLLVERLYETLASRYEVAAFSTRVDSVMQGAYWKRGQAGLTRATLHGVEWDFSDRDITLLATDLFSQLSSSGVGVVIILIHSIDVVAAAALALLRRYSSMKLVVVNHQDHLPGVGLGFADLIVEGRPTGAAATKRARPAARTEVISPQQERCPASPTHAVEDRAALRRQLGVADDEFLTLTGCPAYKILSGGSPQYFEMIRDLLAEEPRLKHLLMTEIHSRNERVLRRVLGQAFSGREALLERLLIMPRVRDYDIYLQSCDLLVDSFPYGGALIHVDMMRRARATVVRIDERAPLRSFEDYFPADYPHRYSSLADLRKGILELLHDETKRTAAGRRLHDHYLARFQFHHVGQRYLDVVERLSGEFRPSPAEPLGSTGAWHPA